MEPLKGLSRDDRTKALATICQPYIQLVEPDTRDEHSGLRHMDIWRYFRHNWATRYRSSLGRNLFYLVRDRAQPGHPVIAITALGNAVMQLAPRDHLLGWTPEGLLAAVERGDASMDEILGAFGRRLTDDFAAIYSADLPVPSELPSTISDELLDRLRRIEEQAVGNRIEHLKDSDQTEEKIDDVANIDLEAMARTPLFRAKRARALRELLRAHRYLRDAIDLRQALMEPEGAWAVQQAIRQLKKHLSATAMMEITVCGAVAPYNHLLGGKLACMMMASPRIVTDYAARYGAVNSIIASQMAGRPISKAPRLVFLGTSSLYGNRSSQYNRVEIPLGTVPGQSCSLRYECVGESIGYGSPNLSHETEATLEALGVASRHFRNVNFVFGEGQSPKFRQLREGFDALGLDRADLLNHGATRLVYALRLARNTTRFLLGIDQEPDYCLPQVDASRHTVPVGTYVRGFEARLIFNCGPPCRAGPRYNAATRLLRGDVPGVLGRRAAPAQGRAAPARP